MEQFSAYFSLIVGLGVIVMQAVIVFLIAAIVIKHKPTLSFVSTWKKQLLFVVSASALLGSIIYSNIIGFTACYLCWIQRGLMLPVALISGFGAAKKIATKKIVLISLPFTILGTVVATYHTLIQNGVGEGSALCQALGGISCVQLYVNQFGYITIPVMSLTVFVLLLLISIAKNKK